MQGKIISGYTLQKLLGKGGMAEVWYAENNIGKTAAVKMLLPKLCEDQNVMSRFRTEAMVMVNLSHPNIRQVYDYGEIDGRPAIVMEYLEGDDLKERMKRGQRFSEADLERWWNQLTDALNYTHQKGIVHRDIKPGNIFVDNNGNIKLLDFGIAKVRESIASTQTGQKLGTLMYMSPEQVRDSKHIDYHTDVYSLAVTFVNLITGKKPYDTETSSDFDISEQIVYKPLDLSGVPEKWAAFLAPYLEKDPLKRPELQYFGNAPASNGGSNDDDATQLIGASARPNTHGGHVSEADEMERRRLARQKAQPLVTETNQDTPVAEEQPRTEKKGKKGLWIALAGAAAALALILILSLGGKKDGPNSDELAFRACQTVNDFRRYVADYGRNALYYQEAVDFIEKYEADSIELVQLAIADSIERAQIAMGEAQRVEAEETAYGNCNTIQGCDNYLRDYPNGRYVAEVRQKREALLEDEEYRKCTTIAACDAYLMKYPNGRYVAQVRKKRQDLEEEEDRPHHQIHQEVYPAPNNPSEPLPSDMSYSPCAIYYFSATSYTIPNNGLNKAADAALRDLVATYAIQRIKIKASILPGEDMPNMAENRANSVKSRIQRIVGSNDIAIVMEPVVGWDIENVISLIQSSNIGDKAQIISELRSSHNKVETLQLLSSIYPEIESQILPKLTRVEVYVY